MKTNEKLPKHLTRDITTRNIRQLTLSTEPPDSDNILLSLSEGSDNNILLSYFSSTKY